MLIGGGRARSAQRPVTRAYLDSRVKVAPATPLSTVTGLESRVNVTNGATTAERAPRVALPCCATRDRHVARQVEVNSCSLFFLRADRV